MTGSVARTVYWLDAELKIIATDGSWDEFAQDNDGRGLGTEEVRGRSIWDFITGDPTRMWFQALLQLAAMGRERVERPYRCDSPEMRRYMHMAIIPEESGVIRVEHVLLRTEERSAPVFIDHHEAGRFGVVDLRCSVCGRIRQGDLWAEPEARSSAGGTYVIVSYTVCDECRDNPPNALH